MRQAEIISSLSEQRDFLIQQAEEQRSRWESERDGWDRMAEALIAQRNKGGTSAAKDEVSLSTFIVFTCTVIINS